MTGEQQRTTSLIIHRPAYDLHGETWDYEHTPGVPVLWLHVTVRRYGPDVLRQMREDWARWRPLYDGPVLVRAQATNTKLLKYLTMFGYRKLGEFSPNDHVYVHINDNGGENGRRR